jgi:hypothetical protein
VIGDGHQSQVAAVGIELPQVVDRSRLEADGVRLSYIDKLSPVSETWSFSRASLATEIPRAHATAASSRFNSTGRFGHSCAPQLNRTVVILPGPR